jgi:hypothetical protein
MTDVRVVLIAAICLVASACVSAGAREQPDRTGLTATSTSPSTAVSRVQSPRTIETPSFIRATFPADWYGQQYDTATIAITSFPVHLMIDSVRALPAHGAVLTILDSPPRANGCGAAPRPRLPLRLGHFQPNFEMFGAAYRIQFRDRGHTIVVFVSFGAHARSSTRTAAVAVLNSIRAEQRVCP